MKSRLLFAVMLPILFSSCDESFNPKTDFEEKYAMFAVIENNPPLYTPSVNVVIVKTFDIDGYNPLVNTKDNRVKGCRVTVIVDNKEKILQELLHSYTGSFKAGPEEVVNIKAELPDGKVLTAQTTVPQILEHLDFSYPFKTGVHTNIDHFAWGNTWNIVWDSYNDDLYFPRLMLEYAKKSPEGLIYYSKEIPLKYVKKNNKYEPVFPPYTWNKSIEYSYDSIDSAMISISAGDSLKENYIIMNITFGIIEFERNLASFYSSTNGYLDGYSIRLDESTYSNVFGGLGVFGACTRNYQVFDVNRDYVESFGYTDQK